MKMHAKTIISSAAVFLAIVFIVAGITGQREETQRPAQKTDLIQDNDQGVPEADIAEAVMDEVNDKILEDTRNFADEINNEIMDELGVDSSAAREYGEPEPETETETEETFLPDTSQGSWHSGPSAEQGEYLYFQSGNMIYRQGVKGELPERLIAFPENVSLGYVDDIMVTEQYLYVKLSEAYGSWICQYQLNGEYAGEVTKLDYSTYYYEEGYFYYEHEGSICRKKAEPGSEEEILAGEYLWYTPYAVQDGKIYYENEDGQLMQMNLDGSEPKMLDQKWQEVGLRDRIRDGYLYTNGTRRNLLTQNTEELPLQTDDGFLELGGFFIKNLYVYSVKGTGDSGDSIWTYNPDTGENKCIVRADSSYEVLEVGYAAGADHIYYTRKTTSGEDEKPQGIYCVDVEGGEPVSLGEYFVLFGP